MRQVVVVGGWGIPASPLCSLLPEGVEPVILDPTSMAARHGDLHAALAAVMETVPWGVPWLGWSLGGQVAMAARERFSDRVGGVITLCSTPCFLEAPGWPTGMAEAEFRGFREGVLADVEQTLGRFCALVSQGAPSPRTVRRELQAQDWPALTPDYERGLVNSLEWLAALDQRALWQQAGAWARHLFGARDALVNASVPGALGLAGERYHLAAEACHWPGTVPGVRDWISKTLESLTP
ncbi:hypothetical protein ACMDCT_06955 [Halomonadaceae bacterium KBTZ08]